jgi:hypothetical protein
MPRHPLKVNLLTEYLPVKIGNPYHYKDISLSSMLLKLRNVNAAKKSRWKTNLEYNDAKESVKKVKPSHRKFASENW